MSERSTIVAPDGASGVRELDEAERRAAMGGCPKPDCKGQKADFRPVLGGEEYCRLCGYQRKQE